MQIKSLRLKSYRSWRIDDSAVSEIAKQRLKKLEGYWRMRAEGCSEKTALALLEVSRATLYRWQSSYRQAGLKGLELSSKAPHHKRQPMWSKQLEQQVLHLRQRYPLWGKRTLTTLLKRERGIEVSESTVGRILRKLVLQGKVKPVSWYYGKPKVKRPRVFNKHAKRWKKGMKAKHPGELLQLDHMTVSVWPGRTLKHFEATCPVTKITVAQVYQNASSTTACEFLAYVKQQLPFALHSIQVDGGSEFKKDFEAACEQAQIALYVLPPKSPELNGCVERCNRTLRYEFYSLYDGLYDYYHLRSSLVDYLKLYNTFRPHQALNQATPFEYYQAWLLEAA